MLKWKIRESAGEEESSGVYCGVCKKSISEVNIQWSYGHIFTKLLE